MFSTQIRGRKAFSAEQKKKKKCEFKKLLLKSKKVEKNFSSKRTDVKK